MLEIFSFILFKRWIRIRNKCTLHFITNLSCLNASANIMEMILKTKTKSSLFIVKYEREGLLDIFYINNNKKIVHRTEKTLILLFYLLI